MNATPATEITGHLQRLTLVKKGLWRITLQGHRGVLATSAVIDGVRFSYQVPYVITHDDTRHAVSIKAVPTQVITWEERDGRHVSYARGTQAANLLAMIDDDPTMTLVSVVSS